MSVIDTAMYTVHLLFAGLWTGTVLFVAIAILPVADRGDVTLDLLDHVTSRLKLISRVSALLLFISGGHLAGNFYTVSTLTGTTRGYLVIAMLLLWLALAALVEIGAARLSRGIDAEKIRTPAKDARPFLLAGAVVALLLLLDAGLLAAGVA